VAAEISPAVSAPVKAEAAPAEEQPEDIASLAAMFDIPTMGAQPEPAPEPEAPTIPEASASVEADDAFAMDDVFSNEAALAELVATTPALAEPADETAAAMADEAATDMMAMESGIQAEDPFDMDDVFSSAAQEDAAKPVAEVEPVAETDPFAMDDVFASEAALADLVAEAPLAPAEPEDSMAAAMADEAAMDVMAMASGEAEAEDQFALDDVFADAATLAEPVAEPKEDLAALLADAPEAKPEPDAKSDDHTAALSAAFGEDATADLADLDFGFDIDLGETPAAPKAPVKAVEKVPALDFSNINLDVGGKAAETMAETASAEPPEVDTKLDLVTAYIDMSDNDGARELLQEVLKEGGPNQVAKAQKMLDSLG
jgi:pilus assembly protein FimV